MDHPEHLSLHLFAHALTVTAFVAVIMVVADFLNVVRAGRLFESLRGRRVLGVAVATLLGTLPGCLGSFAAVTLFLHRAIGLPALVACSIATVGDEEFLMLALFPGQFAVIMVLCAATGFATGLIMLACSRPAREAVGVEGGFCPETLYHPHADVRPSFSLGRVLERPAHWSGLRRNLLALHALLLIGLATARIAGEEPPAMRLFSAAVVALSLLLIAGASDHFIEEHLWNHTIRAHVPRIFLWVLGILLVVTLFDRFLTPGDLVREHPWGTLLFASVVGIIPQSGPHMMFSFLYKDGALPFGVLLANSIVQEGHMLLPLLPVSRRDAILVKAVKLPIGLALGAIVLLLGR